MRPLILITNDDGVNAKGIAVLTKIARDFGDVVVMAPDRNASGKSHSLSTEAPLRVNTIASEPGLRVYSCSGTPVDCVKLAEEHFCERPADLVLSGINHGSNASVNVLYSGTMGAVLEASNNGFDAIGFSLLDHHADADFSACVPLIRHIIDTVLRKHLPKKVSLNVNFPPFCTEGYRGIRVCRESKAMWADSFEKRTDPYGRDYYWLTGNFICHDHAEDTDQWALENGFVSVVPTTTDFTAFDSLSAITELL